MSVSKRLELLDHLSELIATIHDNTIRLKYLCDSNQEKLINLHRDSVTVYSGLQQNSVNEELQNVSLGQEVEDLRCKLRVLTSETNLDEEVLALQKERNGYLGEIEQFNDALQMFSDDHLTLENEIREKEELQAQIHSLREEIVQRNVSMISKLQIENSRLKSESGKLLEEFAQAIQVDEGLCETEQ
ncbi:hypothetical protein JH06_3130 [Blastocystis sp. subtype 4]|uniref:hypothetical protein n=1 Tax=Blastocystis sp. subtype 4 TaxID=944170 RepID=UPI00071207B0|nr:hypothetical protein JH06_3130 [Blastocystis sp. subtype 4]KNB44854.1 hypothetical protein JH06_3130 [Blastocystis sp. subtype 4]|eukprot:XP_014528297.1 hypothetical protein JH06_3130 [Blastocystis sp. subtype 4]